MLHNVVQFVQVVQVVQVVQCLNARKNLYAAIRFFMLNIAKTGSCEYCLNKK